MGPTPLTVTLTDGFWAPRVEQLRDHTLPVLLDRLTEHGAIEAFTRLHQADPAPRRGLWFTDSDVYKWMEGAARAGRHDLLDPVVEVVAAAQQPDGYLHTFSGLEPFGPAVVAGGAAARYRDLTSSHELYCAGHLIEAAVTHHAATGRDDLLDVAVRLADHVCATFGPVTDPRVDGHPEIELAMARLAAVTGDDRHLAFARWSVETLLDGAGLTVDTLDLAGHAVKALYLASGIAEVALATGDPRWRACAERLWTTLVHERSYPTGAVGGRWLGEAVGRPFELGDETAYAESCAAVAAVQFARRIHALTGDVACLDHLELVLYNAVACGVGEDGESWFYSQPQAWHGVADRPEQNPWAQPWEYQESMQLRWFPPRRHRWYDVTCCPSNLARLYPEVPELVAALEPDGSLRVDLPASADLRGGGWHVQVGGRYPDDGAVTVRVLDAPAGGASVRVRVPGPPGTPGRWHTVVGAAGTEQTIEVPIEARWEACDPRVLSAIGRRYWRRGPIVYCAEVPADDAVDLRLVGCDDVVVDPPAGGAGADPSRSLVPYHRWANGGPSRMTVLLRTDRVTPEA